MVTLRKLRKTFDNIDLMLSCVIGAMFGSIAFVFVIVAVGFVFFTWFPDVPIPTIYVVYSYVLFCISGAVILVSHEYRIQKKKYVHHYVRRYIRYYT